VIASRIPSGASNKSLIGIPVSTATAAIV